MATRTGAHPPTTTTTDGRRPGLFANIKDDFSAAGLEFVGTTLFLLLGLGGIQSAAFSNQGSVAAAASSSGAGDGAQAINTVASIDQLLYICTSMGLALLVSVWLFYRVTGGLFNPAVSTALLLIGAIGPLRFVLYCIAQLLGGIAASALILALTPGPLVVSTSPGPGISSSQAVFIEMFITAALVLSVLMLAAEKHRVTPFAPIGIGLTLFSGHLWGVIYTGAAMNTARAFGPAVVSGFNGRHWVYWLGPFLGSLLATALYMILKRYRYWHLNPDQDTDDPRRSPNFPGTDAYGNTAVNPDNTTHTTDARAPINGGIHEKRPYTGGPQNAV